jgi:diguanylate cyclase (GGDEF)-like protein/PAS domain S-box-containing protein
VLLVDDDEDDYVTIRDLFADIKRTKFDVEWAATYDDALQAIVRQRHDVYLVDYRLGEHDGLELLQEATRNGCKAPVVFLTGEGNHDVDLKAMNAGAAEYLVKSQITEDQLERSIRYAIAHAQTLDELRASQERYALAMNGANDGLWYWNLDSNEVHFSARWKSMLGYEEQEIGSSPEEWLKRIHAEDLERVKAEITAHLDGQTPHYENEHRMLHKDGAYRWMLSRGVAVRGADGKAHRMAGSLTDVTERKRFEEQLERQAFYDPLTNLPNRALFMNRLAHAIEQGKRRRNYSFAVLFLDLDRFKMINDSLGHSVGDQMLIEAARRLELCLRPGDTIARLGGDEFTILLNDLKDFTYLTHIAERIQKVLMTPFNLNGEEVFTSASIGIATNSRTYNRPEEILRDADTAMYRAKLLGKAQYALFDTGMHVEAMRRLQLETDLRRALERQEFRIHYQPIIALGNGEITGFEALLRWQHPYRGLIGPAEFIPVAEETGLIIPIGQWVLREACRQMHLWQAQYDSNCGLTVSVNVSPKQLAQPDLADQVRRILAETGLEASSLRLEITESAIMENTESARQLLAQLKEMEVQLYMDDFGTGYSSLSNLSRFPVDTLKVDRSFVKDLSDYGESSDILWTIVTLARNLGMHVIAEGVETAEQLAQLRALKCECAQGYFFSEPQEGRVARALISMGVAGTKTEPWREEAVN